MLRSRYMPRRAHAWRLYIVVLYPSTVLPARLVGLGDLQFCSGGQHRWVYIQELLFSFSFQEKRGLDIHTVGNAPPQDLLALRWDGVIFPHTHAYLCHVIYVQILATSRIFQHQLLHVAATSPSQRTPWGLQT
ncbi:hypothetical protein FN846DRAFT_936909, partial [Sphaerosporella brunnea]